MKTMFLATAFLISFLVGTAGAVEVPVPAAESDERPLSPMMQEITDLQAATHQAVAELASTLADAREQEQIMTIQREIGRLKSEARVETMRIQLKYAQAEGNEEAAAKLEEIIARLTTPRQPATQVRPAPAQAKK
jgi:hypothetical protein